MNYISLYFAVIRQQNFDKVTTLFAVVLRLRVSIEGVKNLCPLFKIVVHVCQFRIYSPKNIHSKFIINDNLP